jgi:hypothetical protein
MSSYVSLFQCPNFSHIKVTGLLKYYLILVAIVIELNLVS